MIQLVVDASQVRGVAVLDTDRAEKKAVLLLAYEDLVPLKRATSFPPKRSQWWIAADRSVTIGCPNCGQVIGHNPAIHTIEQDGALSPSFICPHQCGAHTWIRLEGWVP